MNYCCIIALKLKDVETMRQTKNLINYIIYSALIAAFYVGLTFLGNIFGLSYGPIQLRISEVLTILPVFTSAAVPGLTIGCFIANIASFNLLDMFFGSIATLIAAYLTCLLKDIKFKGIPVLAFLPPVIVNALIIGFEIAVFYLPQSFYFMGFIISALQVGVGQLIVCYGFGIPFYLMLRKHNNKHKGF